MIFGPSDGPICPDISRETHTARTCVQSFGCTDGTFAGADATQFLRPSVDDADQAAMEILIDFGLFELLGIVARRRRSAHQANPGR
jgi:hypothetical protein